MSAENDRRLRGAFGESVAAAYYRSLGCKILAANYRTRMGELDLVVQDGETVVFAEVKTRTKSSLAKPAEFVTTQKQKRLLAAAGQYIQYKSMGACPMRFDVVEVYLREGQKPAVHCIKNAFEA